MKIEKETPGVWPEQFDRLTTEARRRISPGSFILAAIFMTVGFILSPIPANAEDAVEGDQKSETVSPYVELYNQGIASLAGGDAARAKALLEEAAGLAPDDPGIMRALIETDIALSAEDNALQKLVGVLSSDKFDGIKDWAAIEYYKLSGKKGGIQSAIDQLAAIKNSSDNLYLQRAIAEGYVRLREWDKVAQIYAGLSQSNPDDQILATRLVDAYMLDQDYEAAIAMLEPQVAANPENTGISDVLARAYVGAKKGEQAVALYKQKIAKNPSSPGLRGRYAQALLDLGMAGESLTEWQEASKLDGKNLLFKQRVAETYMELGRTKEAKSEYRQLLSLIPEGQADFKKYILARIEEIDKAKTKK